ncbi:MAG: nucleotide exchange factor GrpE, partial [Chloroflexi bacterium]|nr:nucleotide exchange factor GrpE [Chloroflexota bacterium]
MFRDFDEFGRRNGRTTQTIDIPRRNRVNRAARQPRDMREAYWLLQQKLQQAQEETAAWQQEARAWQRRVEQLESAVQSSNHGGRQMDNGRRLVEQLETAQQTIAELQVQLAKQADTPTAADKWQEKYIHLAAELENNKKRLAQRYSLEAKREKEKILRDMLPLADNLERALQHGETEPGLELTLKSFQAALARHGVEPMTAEGEPFDPAL